MTEISYVSAPSAGWALLCHGSTVLAIDVPADSPTVAGLWALVRDAADPGRILDEIISAGISRAPSFVLVGSTTAATTTVLVRGAATLRVELLTGVTEYSGAGVSTWVEQSVTGATGFELVVQDAAGPTLPLASGIVLASRFASGSLAAHAGAPGSAAPAAVPPAAVSAPAAPAPAAPPAPVDPPQPPPARAEPAAIVPPAAPEPTPEPEPVADPSAVSEATIAGQTVSAPPEPEPAAASTATASPASIVVPPGIASPPPAAEGGDSYDYLFGETVFRKVEDAAVRVDPDDEHAAEPAAQGPAPADAPAEQAGDHDGHTMMVSDIAAMRAARRAGKKVVAEEAPAAVLYVDLSTGGREHLDQPLVVGRAPSATRVPGGKVPRLVSMSTPNQDISRTHAQITVEGGTVVVTDLHSRNGTMVVLPGKPPQKLREGEPTAVIVGTVIDLGDGATLTVGEA